MFKFILFLLLLTAAPVAGLANDSIAEVKTGGLELTRTDAIAMEQEDLFVSLERIEVSYVFRNRTDHDIDSVVAFPMPDIRYDPYGDTALPETQSDNFLGFSATVAGRSVPVHLQQRAFAAGLDVTEALRGAGVPLFPFGDAAFEALAGLPAATLSDFVARGIVFIDRYDVGEGMEDHPTPAWTLKSTYWWRMTFPAGQAVPVAHTYRPSVGATVGVGFYTDGFHGPDFQAYRQRYCMDEGFVGAVRRAMQARGADYPPFMEKRIGYILHTGNNWAGPIARFGLTVDKGATSNLVSFCGSDVTKTGPTTFRMEKTDFYPESDLDVLFLEPMVN